MNKKDAEIEALESSLQKADSKNESNNARYIKELTKLQGQMKASKAAEEGASGKARIFALDYEAVKADRDALDADNKRMKDDLALSRTQYENLEKECVGLIGAVQARKTTQKMENDRVEPAVNKATEDKDVELKALKARLK
jgi:hypothetical protein